MKPISNSTSLPLALLLALTATATALWCFAFAKAGLSSMTHDEASTYFHHLNSNFFTCLYSADCWKSANNHLLNTALWQQTIRWLGPTELGMRLPNLLGHLVFLASSAFLVLRLTSRLLPGLAAFAILNFNPFLLDFFSLARGYGLSAGFVMAALALWFVYWQSRKPLHLAYCCAALVAAVLSNFVALNIFLAIGAATFLFTLRGDRQTFVRSMAVLGGTALFLGLILHRPIRFLRQGGEFQYGTASLRESLESLIVNPLYGNSYLGASTAPVVAGVIFTAFIAACVYAWLRWRREQNSGTEIFFAASGAAFLLSVAVMIAQHYLLGSVYLVNRTSVPLMPMMSVVLATGVLFLAGDAKRTLPAGALSVLIIFALTWNLVRSANLRYFREWWYDENTKTVMLYMNDLGTAQQKPVTIGVSWLFFPAGEFYRTTLSLQFVAPLPNNHDITPDAGYDYYYIEESQKEILGETYEQLKYYPWGRILMQKKAAPAQISAQ